MAYEKLVTRSIPGDAVEAMDDHLKDNKTVKLRWLAEAIFDKIKREKEIEETLRAIENGEVVIVSNHRPIRGNHGPTEFKG